MTSDRVPDYLDHMLEAATQACVYVEGLSKDAFLQSGIRNQNWLPSPLDTLTPQNSKTNSLTRRP